MPPPVINKGSPKNVLQRIEISEVIMDLIKVWGSFYDQPSFSITLFMIPSLSSLEIGNHT